MLSKYLLFFIAAIASILAKWSIKLLNQFTKDLLFYIYIELTHSKESVPPYIAP
ncbi:MAG: hypothetical protein AAFW70_19050 [Cyanobacteria bacterium J06635_10]